MKRYETHLHSSTHRNRTRTHPDRIALIIGLCAATLPDSVSISARRTSQCHCRATGLRRPDRAQCHQRLQRDGSSRAQERILSPASAAHQHSQRKPGAVAGSLASQSTRLWHPAQSVELAPSGKDQLRVEIGCHPNNGIKRATRSCPAWSQLEAGQALDYQSRSDVSPKKTRTALFAGLIPGMSL